MSSGEERWQHASPGGGCPLSLTPPVWALGSLPPLTSQPQVQSQVAGPKTLFSCLCLVTVLASTVLVLVWSPEAANPGQESGENGALNSSCRSVFIVRCPAGSWEGRVNSWGLCPCRELLPALQLATARFQERLCPEQVRASARVSVSWGSQDSTGSEAWTPSPAVGGEGLPSHRCGPCWAGKDWLTGVDPAPCRGREG